MGNTDKPANHKKSLFCNEVFGLNGCILFSI